MTKATLSDCLAFDAVRITAPPRIYRCEPGWSWRSNRLPDFDLWYVLDGIGQLSFDGTDYRLGPHTCFVFPPGTLIQARHDPRRRLRVFAVHFDLVDRRGRIVAGRQMVLPPQGVTIREAAFFSVLARRCEASYRLENALGRRQSSFLVGQMLLHLWSETEQPSATLADQRINAAVELIQEDPGRRWTVTELAGQAALSCSQFTRRFKTATGLSPEQFLIHSRIERATQLLRESAMSIGAVADALGYCDVYHFSRQYHHITGQTASALRRRLDT